MSAHNYPDPTYASPVSYGQQNIDVSDAVMQSQHAAAIPGIGSEDPCGQLSFQALLSQLGEVFDSKSEGLQRELAEITRRLDDYTKRNDELNATIQSLQNENASLIQRQSEDQGRTEVLAKEFEESCTERVRLEQRLEAAINNHLQQKAQIDELSTTKDKFDSLVPNDFESLLADFDEDRRRVVFAALHGLCELALQRIATPQLITELATTLGVIVYREPRPAVEAIGACVKKLNELFQSGQHQINIMEVRSGESVEPQFMDGPELQGKRFVNDVNNWAVLVGERVIRKAQVTGR